MTISDANKLAKNICRLLKVEDITFPVGRTSKGNLGLRFNQNSDDFEVLLDAVALPTDSLYEHENNIELKKLLGKFMFDQDMPKSVTINGETTPASVPMELSHAKPEKKPTKTNK